MLEYPHLAMDSRRLASYTFGFCALLVTVLFVQTLFPPQVEPRSWEERTEGECKGEPIHIAEPYEGAPVGPHTCIVQCQDGKQRYIVYGNGLATQCEEPPGCNDFGEDHGTVCRIPMSTPQS